MRCEAEASTSSVHANGVLCDATAWVFGVSVCRSDCLSKKREQPLKAMRPIMIFYAAQLRVEKSESQSVVGA